MYSRGCERLGNNNDDEKTVLIFRVRIEVKILVRFIWKYGKKVVIKFDIGISGVSF